MARRERGIPTATVTQLRSKATATAKGGGLVNALRQSATDVRDLPLDQMATNPANPPARSVTDLEPLAESLKTAGQYVPLIVVSATPYLEANPTHAEHVGDRAWVVVAGHRRLAAAALAGLDSLTVIVRDDLVHASTMTSIVENVQRLALTPLEEASAYAMLCELGMTQRDIAAHSGVSQGQVSKRLSLLTLPTQAQDKIAAGDLEIGEALKVAASLKTGAVTAGDVVTGIAALDGDDGGDKAAIHIFPDDTFADVVETAREQRERHERREAVRAEVAEQGGSLEESAHPSWNWEEREARRLTTKSAIAEAAKAGTLVAYLADYQKEPHYYSTAPLPKAEKPLTREQLDQRERNRATKLRADAATTVARHHPSEAELLAMLVAVVLDGIGHGELLRRAWKWLGEECGDPDASDHYAWERSLPTDETTRRRIAWAIAIADHERGLKEPYRTWGTRDVAYMDLLTKLGGYEPTEWEQARLRAVHEDHQDANEDEL